MASFRQFNYLPGTSSVVANLVQLKGVFALHPEVPNLDFLEIVERRSPSTVLPPSLIEYLRKLQEYWGNLDGNEAARRTYIDPWLNAALEASGRHRPVIRVEDNIAHITATGHSLNGRLDYIISESGQPAPSLIGEAKSMSALHTHPYDGIGQAVAAMVAVSRLQAYTDPMRAFVTDGLFWRFMEWLPFSNIVHMSRLLYAGTPANWLGIPPPAHDHLSKEAWGILKVILENYRSRNPILSAMLGLG